MMGLAVGSARLTRGRVESYPFRLPLSLRDRAAFAVAGVCSPARRRPLPARDGRPAGRLPRRCPRPRPRVRGPPHLRGLPRAAAARRRGDLLDRLAPGDGRAGRALGRLRDRPVRARLGRSGIADRPQPARRHRRAARGARRPARCARADRLPTSGRIRPEGDGHVVDSSTTARAIRARHVILAVPGSARGAARRGGRRGTRRRALGADVLRRVPERRRRDARDAARCPGTTSTRWPRPGRAFDMFTNQSHALRTPARAKPGGTLMLFAGRAGGRGADARARRGDHRSVPGDLVRALPGVARAHRGGARPALADGQRLREARSRSGSSRRSRARSGRTRTSISPATTSPNSAISRWPPGPALAAAERVDARPPRGHPHDTWRRLHDGTSSKASFRRSSRRSPRTAPTSTPSRFARSSSAASMPASAGSSRRQHRRVHGPHARRATEGRRADRRDRCRPRPVVAAPGALTTAETVELSVHAERAGAAGVMIVPPFYGAPDVAGASGPLSRRSPTASRPDHVLQHPEHHGRDPDAEQRRDLARVARLRAEGHRRRRGRRDRVDAEGDEFPRSSTAGTRSRSPPWPPACARSSGARPRSSRRNASRCIACSSTTSTCPPLATCGRACSRSALPRVAQLLRRGQGGVRARRATAPARSAPRCSRSTTATPRSWRG